VDHRHYDFSNPIHQATAIPVQRHRNFAPIPYSNDRCSPRRSLGPFLQRLALQSIYQEAQRRLQARNRLFGAWPAVVISVCSLVLCGQTLQHSLSWAGIVVGWGMNTFAVLAATTAVSAYVLDCFPGHAALASSLLNFWRVLGMYSSSSWSKGDINRIS
jgi:hypothetical protein